MQINLDDIKMFGKLYAYNAIKFYGNKEILSQDVTAKVISDAEKKYSWENILKSKYAIDVVESYIAGSILEYHDQLRQKLLEHSIDIGEIDEEHFGNLRTILTESEADGEE